MVMKKKTTVELKSKTKYTFAQLLPQVGEMPIIHPAYGDLDCKLKIQGMWVPSVKQKALEAVTWLQKTNKEQTPEDMVKLITKVETISSESAALAVVGWTDDVTMGGPYSPAYASEVLGRPDMGWLRDQVNEFIGDQRNFFRKADPKPDSLDTVEE